MKIGVFPIDDENGKLGTLEVSTVICYLKKI